ncbi:EF-hand domain-containing protein 1 [Coelomomyces lativittatus]|nr:EF-hand domain-containing protein 1 [Coelomomyces lativittatus]KAJ1515518.1 EF-hand domain-containing protein 1 [Coelomomyces lativittatus]KAJ1518238.1 EF-hand domain-containing protein 1 [Coelomomyces lativittatus]
MSEASKLHLPSDELSHRLNKLDPTHRKDKYEIYKALSIPFLPGNSFNNVFTSDFKKNNLLKFKNGYPISKECFWKDQAFEYSQEEFEKLMQDLKVPPSLTYGDKLSLLPPSTEPLFVPSFVVYDKVVLRFRAYTKQTIHNSVEQYLLRVVNILYYLEDDSIAVIEPPQRNSGILQGVLIKRQRLPKTSTEFYTIHDLDCGINVTFYEKTFRIIDCDEYTRNYMKEAFNKELNSPEPCPEDPYLLSRIRPEPTHQSHTFSDKLCKFLKFDRQVLRFYCAWEEATGKRDFVLHYYLVDDCVEFRETHKPNDGRDPCPLLLKRQHLPKQFKELHDLSTAEYYTWKDLRVGYVINVLNRKMVILDCDDFTRRFYEEKLGLSMTPLNLHTSPPPSIQNVYPPYNGFGSEEDSLQSCKHLVLQPPKREFLLNQENKVLRFVAMMDSRHQEDSERRFVISFYVMDDSVSIYEPPLRNSGTVGGKFLERGPVLLPGYTKQNPMYHRLHHFYVGAKLIIHSHAFQLLDADECVYVYMEKHKDKFPYACVHTVWEKVKGCQKEHEVHAALLKLDHTQARKHLKQLLEPSLVLHEIITLQRFKEKVIEFYQGTMPKVESKEQKEETSSRLNP